ncbi:hypothetical protein ACH3VR_09330 [Microbacterium sp. B2969]|uniref:Integral membrane protein n=1 Tax=Microbacterium alkaliflavum TaxID=3248839 RepID=A0ABW7Q6T2_9MICO
MARIRISADFDLRARKDKATSSEPKVLELRVHGVNNTTAAALLDVKPEEVEEVIGDKLGSFWRPTEEAVKARTPGERGYVPPYVVREAYSWGGMVRTTPDLGSGGAAGTIPAAIARVLYALLLPFSIANAAQWTRMLDVGQAPVPKRIWIALTAGAARLFSLVLTLMYTVTAATLAFDLGAAQCAVAPDRCGPIQGVMTAFVGWTAGQRIALFALAPVLAVFVLWVVSGISRLRYDVLSGVKGTAQTMGPRPTPALAQAGFWSNRITGALARSHVAAAMALTVLLALHAADGLWTAGSGAAAWADGVRIAALILFVCDVALTAVLPTGSLTAEEDWRQKLTRFLSGLLLVLTAIATAAGLVLVAFAPAGDVPEDTGTGAVFFQLVAWGGLLALTGIVWRLFGGMLRTAWLSAGPFVIMTLALGLAAAISSIVVVGVSQVVQTKPETPAAGEPPAAPVTPLVIPDVYSAIGATILLAALVTAVIVGVLLIWPRNLTKRASAWGQAAKPDDLQIPDGGVLPPSAAAMFARIRAKRTSAARRHLAEPIVGILSVLLALALAAGLQWTRMTDGNELWEVTKVPWLDTDASSQAIQTFVGIAAPVLGWIGVGLVALLVSGAATGGQRPLGTVWDIACYLPRTGHPFGPPCYAERAVPEIAGRLFDWLEGDTTRRAVLSAHSMGAVLAVSSLGLLASQSTTDGLLSRISLLTFGVQLRAYFGRMLPDLLGPEVLGTTPSRPPGFGSDPWKGDFTAQDRPAPSPARVIDSLQGAILIGTGVRWINLWRLTDFLGFPAMSTARTAVFRGAKGAESVWVNKVDRFAEELDLSGYMVEVGTHGEYYRVPAYAKALEELVLSSSAVGAKK